ncbi:MAG TPA: IS1595 family transposase [Tepidisphaeraceae bacterium]|jgi:hypothetical protein
MNANESQMPETLIEAVRMFSNLDFATAFFAAVRWPAGVCCPNCGSTNVLHLPSRRMWECREKHERRQFSVKIGTIFEKCRLPIDKCLIAVWLEVNAKNSISSYEVGRHLGITQKTAWFLQHRIRLALNVGSFDKMAGTVEADETFIGGKARNMHKGKRKAKGRGVVGKAAVMGLLERHSEKGKSKVRTFVVDNTKRKTLQPVVRTHVEAGSNVYLEFFRIFGKEAKRSRSLSITGKNEKSEATFQIPRNYGKRVAQLIRRPIRVTVEYGSLEGTLVQLSNDPLKDDGTAKLRERDGGNDVYCHASPDIAANMGHHINRQTRIVVYGNITFEDGIARRIDVEDFSAIPETLPTLEDIHALQLKPSGGMSIEDFLSDMRGDE